MGPISAKTYPGAEWQQGPERATFEPDYGRRGKLWAGGAFEPATGKAAILTSARLWQCRSYPVARTDDRGIPHRWWLIVEDNFSAHTSRLAQLSGG